MTFDHETGGKAQSWSDRQGGAMGAARSNDGGAGLPAGSRHGMRIKPVWWLAGALVSLALWYGIYLIL